MVGKENKMNVIKELAIKAGLKATHASDREGLSDFDYRAYANLIAKDIITIIQLHMPRNGVSSPENLQSKRHIADIAERYGVTLPITDVDYNLIDNMLAGAKVVEDFGGYEESTHEKQAEFAKKRNYKIPKPEPKTCLMCSEPATWVRSTQFAGDHPFCEEHAKQEDDFNENDSYTFWYEIK